jgi:hypothetical protein
MTIKTEKWRVVLNCNRARSSDSSRADGRMAVVAPKE